MGEANSLVRVSKKLYFKSMSTLSEIEAAIEKLPEPQIDELAQWFSQRLAMKGRPAGLDEWITRARGAAKLGVTTDSIMSETRGED